MKPSIKKYIPMYQRWQKRKPWNFNGRNGEDNLPDDSKTHCTWNRWWFPGSLRSTRSLIDYVRDVCQKSNLQIPVRFIKAIGVTNRLFWIGVSSLSVVMPTVTRSTVRNYVSYNLQCRHILNYVSYNLHNSMERMNKVHGRLWKAL